MWPNWIVSQQTSNRLANVRVPPCLSVTTPRDSGPDSPSSGSASNLLSFDPGEVNTPGQPRVSEARESSCQQLPPDIFQLDQPQSGRKLQTYVNTCLTAACCSNNQLTEISIPEGTLSRFNISSASHILDKTLWVGEFIIFPKKEGWWQLTQ